MGTVEFGMLADENNFKLRPIKMTLPGGDINAEYVVEKTADGVDMRLNIYVERLDYGDLLRLIDPNVRQDAGGYLYVDTSLTSSASTTARLASAVQGDVALMIIPEDAAACQGRDQYAQHVAAREKTAKLTEREAEVMDLVVSGLRNKQIAATLGISEKTVKVHRGHVMRKVGARSVTDLVRISEIVSNNP